MSMSLMAKAMSIKVGNPLRKLVLLKLADNANDKGEAWPSIPHIAQQCEMAERTVQGHVQSLQKSGFLWIEKRKGSNGINQSNIYHLTLEKGEEESRKCGEFPAPSDGATAAPYGESPAPHGANTAPGDGATAAPRTSHSFEPVIEPVKNIPLPLADKKNKFDPLTEKPSNVSAEVWADWVSHRKEIRHPLTPTTCKRIRSMLENHVNPDAVISLSIERGWQGLFPEKITEPANTTPAFDVSRLTEEQRRELALYELLEGR
ncbi:MAG: helix-turn-helix domain-containing protein [Candidatus Symbiopectobacterium sp. Dall1.0]|nr:helix-turn-helix domain-containing protein [Candidatus Symbiopectobacterium sp. Dall1.0]